MIGTVPAGRDLLRNTSLSLSTLGRRTGRTHRVVVWFAYDDGACRFLAHARDHGRGTDWYRNLVAAGEATARVGAWTCRLRHEAFPSGTDGLGLVLRLFEAKYGAAAVAHWYRPSGRIPVRARVVDARI